MSRKIKKHKKKPTSYKNRTYRQLVDSGNLLSCNVKVRETDLHILAPVDIAKDAENLVWQYRNQLENYISKNPAFSSSLAPLPEDALALPIIREMLRASKAAEVGPMAAVAGVISEFVGRELVAIQHLDEIMVENGGDIFLWRRSPCTIAIFAGPSPLSNKVGIKISASQMPLGICTSSATVGHSLSLGHADAVTVLSASTALADAAATRLGNEVQKDRPLEAVLEMAGNISGVQGVVIIRGEEIGAWGEIELVNC
jgi:ApbE superfamily uncharacterized protein (UPF0280 family)